jgi:hypothetical protein
LFVSESLQSANHVGRTRWSFNNLADVAGTGTIGDVGDVIYNIFSIAAARTDVKNNKVNCSIGPEALINQVRDVSSKLAINEKATFSLLRIIGQDQNVTGEKLPDLLIKVAGDYKRLQAQVAALNPDNPDARRLVDEAEPEIEAGHFARAHELLQEARQAQVAAMQKARKLIEQAQVAEDAQSLGAASVTAADGDLAMTERRYLEAAELFSQAASYVPSIHPGEHGGYLLRQGDALSRQGDERADNAALK